jgi:hypothetical protein
MFQGLREDKNSAAVRRPAPNETPSAATMQIPRKTGSVIASLIRSIVQLLRMWLCPIKASELQMKGI